MKLKIVSPQYVSLHLPKERQPVLPRGYHIEASCGERRSKYLAVVVLLLALFGSFGEAERFPGALLNFRDALFCDVQINLCSRQHGEDQEEGYRDSFFMEVCG